MSMSSREQLVALLALISAIILVGETPVIVAGILGKNLPDALIAMSDKTLTGLVGILGTIAGLIFRQSRADDARADNTGKAFDAIAATANAANPKPDVTLNPGETAQAAPVDRAE